MKKITSKRKGLTLMEVIISIALISIVLVGFISGFSTNFINLFKSKKITVDTFRLQEILEDKIVQFKETDLGIDKIIVYGKDIKYKKIETDAPDVKRKLVMYMSKPSIGVLPTPEIKDFTLKAYDKGNKEVFPWYEEGIRLEASYITDSITFQKNYAWYESEVVNGFPITNPSFSSDYKVVKFKNGVYKGAMTYPDKKLEHKEMKNNRYYHYSIIPYSEAGRLGRMAINEERLLVIKRTANSYWNSLIEDVYLNKSNVVLKPQTIALTMNNINEVTLNVESDNSKIDNSPLLYYPIPDYKTNNSSFKTIIEAKFDDNSIGKEAGIGVFLGKHDSDKEEGIIFLLDQKNNEVKVNRIKNGKFDSLTSIKSFNIPSGFDWSKRYKWFFEIHRSGVKDLKLSYIGEDNKNIELTTKSQNGTMDLDFITNHIGLKTWSDYNIKDISNEEHKYVYNLTAHFYDIKFEEVKNDKNFGMFMFGGGLNISAGEIVGNDKSIYFDSDLNPDNMKNNVHINVSNMYVKENLKLPSGSHQLGSKEKPGEIHVNKDFIETGSRHIYGNIYVGGNFVSNNSSSTIHGDIHVQKDLILWDGSMSIYGDIFVNGNFKLKGANIHKNVYVGGNVELGWTPTLATNTRIYYTGELTYPQSGYSQDILRKLIKVSSIDEDKKAKRPNIPEPKYPELKEDSWYRNNGYVILDSLKDNIKIYANSYTERNWVGNANNIIIIAKTGDIRIENFGNIKGILFAPNGKVYLNGGNFEGLIIAKNGIDYVQGGGKITIKSIDEILTSPADYPFQ